MNRILLACLIAFVCVSFTAAEVTITNGACPNGTKLGDSWYKPKCEKCECAPNAVKCFTCNYTKYPKYCKVTYENANYPKCCIATVDCPKRA